MKVGYSQRGGGEGQGGGSVPESTQREKEQDRTGLKTVGEVLKSVEKVDESRGEC